VTAESTYRPKGRARIPLAAAGLMLALAGCTTANMSRDGTRVDPKYVAMYAPVAGEPFRIPAVPVNRVDPQYFRQTVATPADIPHDPGTIVVDPYDKFLYLVQDNGESIRYGIGVGKQGFAWSGEAEIQDKQQWPKWFPPQEMQARDSYAARFADGMNSGPRNPLGSRALYLYEGKCNQGNIRTANCRDTLYRIHGTSEPLSIGKAVSSGCIRMWNQDAIDLYNRVPIGTKVVVLSGPSTTPLDASAPAVAAAPGSGGDPAVGGSLTPDGKPVAVVLPTAKTGAI